MTKSERAARAFAHYWKHERRRADKYIEDISSVLLDPKDETPLSEREERIIDMIIAYTERRDQRVTDQTLI